jgi:hypothetical protein
MKRRALWIGVVVGVLFAGSTGSAWADGLPVLGIDAGPTGVATSTGDARYVTLPAGGSTVVARISSHGGRILASRLVRGTFTIPAVAYDGTAGGLSADGETLVLISPRAAFPRARTPLVVLDAKRPRQRSDIRLRGDFSYDAVSPNGRWLYLIQYNSPRDPTKYLVRAYDLKAGRLIAQPIIDPRERGEKMRGLPVTRAASADGRWAYTLYDGAGRMPFIHALDTTTRSARCIDLDGIAVGNVSRLRLRLDDGGTTLIVRSPGGAVGAVDTRTFQLSRLTPEAAPANERSATGDGFPWGLVIGSIAGVLAMGAALSLIFLRRRQRLVPVQ